MQEVEKEILEKCENSCFPGPLPFEKQGGQHGFDYAAEIWAVVSLRVYDGKLLRKALAVSTALAEFTAELIRKGDE